MAFTIVGSVLSSAGCCYEFSAGIVGWCTPAPQQYGGTTTCTALNSILGALRQKTRKKTQGAKFAGENQTKELRYVHTSSDKTS